MAFLLPDLKTSVETLLKDDADFLTSAEIDEIIQQGLRHLNRDRPFEFAVDITGDGTQDYALPATFQKGFSMVRQVEFPAGENPPVFLDESDDWFLYEDPTKAAGSQQRLRFKESTPSATDKIRVTLSTPHTVDGSTSTLDQTAYQAATFKAATLAFRSLAARFMQSTDPTIAADSVDYGQQAQNYLFEAERYNTNYKELIGQMGKPPAAQALDEIDIGFMHGEDFLMHGRRRR